VALMPEPRASPTDLPSVSPNPTAVPPSHPPHTS
jgi:hypothetical protein